MFPLFMFHRIFQLNCKFKRLAVSSQQNITLLLKMKPNNGKEKFFQTNKCKPMSLNVGTNLFDSHFKSSNVSLSVANIKIKRCEKVFYPLVLNLERTAVFQRYNNNIIQPKYRFAAQNIPGLALLLFKSM